MKIFITLLALFIPGYTLSKFVSEEKSERIKNSLIITLIIFPLVSLFTYLIFKTPINPQNSLIQVIFINITALLAGKYIKKKKVKTNKKPDFPPIFLAIFSALLFSYFYFSYHPLLLGVDVANLTYDMAHIIKNHNIRYLFDRSFLLLFPTIIHQLSGLSVEIGLRIYMLLYYVLLSQATYLLSKKILKDTPISMLTTFIVLLSETFLFQIAYIIPNVLAIIMLFSLVEIFVSNKKISNTKLIFALIVWASLFNLHGVTAFGSLLIIPTILLLTLKKKFKKNIKPLLLGTILFLSLAQPILFTKGKNITTAIIRPYFSNFMSKKSSSQSDSINKPMEWESDVASDARGEKITEIPIHTKYYISIYSLPLTLFAVYGLLIMIQEKNSKNHPFIIATIILFLFSQQRLVGMDWFSPRFVHALSPFMYLLMVYGVIALVSNLKKLKVKLPQTAVLVIVIALSIIPLKSSISDIRATSSNISSEEHKIYSSLNDYASDQTIYIISPFAKFAYGIDPYKNFFRAKSSLMCGDLTDRQKKIPQNIVSRGFSTNTTSIEESVSIAIEHAGSEEYFVILNTETANCINPDLFSSTHYIFLVDGEQTGTYLLKSKSSPQHN